MRFPALLCLSAIMAGCTQFPLDYHAAQQRPARDYIGNPVPQETCEHDGDLAYPHGVPFCGQCWTPWHTISQQATGATQ